VPRGRDGDAFRAKCAAERLLVVHDEAEVPVPVRLLPSPLGEGDELVAQVDERHTWDSSAQPKLEKRAVERQRLVDRAYLERDVVDADEPRHWNLSAH